MNMEMVQKIAILGVGVGIGFFVGAQITKLKYEELIDHIEETYTETYDIHEETQDETSAAIMESTVDGIKVQGLRNVRRRDRRNYNEIASKYSEEDNGFKEGRRLSAEANEPKSGNPYVITLEEFSEEKDHYDKITIYYYEDDQVLTDADETPIEDVNATIGNEAFDNFGNGSNDPEMVYIRNDRKEIDYEVIRLSKSYAKTVGIDED